MVYVNSPQKWQEWLEGKGLGLSFSYATYLPFCDLYESQFSHMKSGASHVYVPEISDYFIWRSNWDNAGQRTLLIIKYLKLWNYKNLLSPWYHFREEVYCPHDIKDRSPTTLQGHQRRTGTACILKDLRWINYFPHAVLNS